MKNSVLTVLLLSVSHLTIAQSKTDFSKLYMDDLYSTSSKIRSISPGDTNFNDLEPIGKSIDEAKIVLLGEPSHGDGGSIHMKTRLVKYLHEKKALMFCCLRPIFIPSCLVCQILKIPLRFFLLQKKIFIPAGQTAMSVKIYGPITILN